MLGRIIGGHVAGHVARERSADLDGVHGGLYGEQERHGDPLADRLALLLVAEVESKAKQVRLGLIVGVKPIAGSDSFGRRTSVVGWPRCNFHSLATVKTSDSRFSSRLTVDSLTLSVLSRAICRALPRSCL